MENGFKIVIIADIERSAIRFFKEPHMKAPNIVLQSLPLKLKFNYSGERKHDVSRKDLPPILNGNLLLA